jgi:hypothetical protein
MGSLHHQGKPRKVGIQSLGTAVAILLEKNLNKMKLRYGPNE